MLYVELCHPSGAQLDVYLHGAHATSWRDKNGNELLFLSKKSLFKPDFPIRGGIPVVFPQFGGGPLPKHGFARIAEWTYLRSGMSSAGCAEAVFELADSDETMRFWPHKFRLELVFRLSPAELEVCFSVRNAGQSDFIFQNGLHTYFAAADINRAAVEGLAGKKFIDFLEPGPEATEKRPWITFDREVDRVYPFAPDKLVMEDGGNRREIVIEKQGMNDVVVWNPWADKSRRMEDFGDEEYKSMVCVETGNLHEPVRLGAGAVQAGSTKFISGMLKAQG